MSPTPTDLTDEQREERRTRARDLIEAALRDRFDVWHQTPPRLDWAADIALDALGTPTTNTETPDPVGLCGACGAPREGHHHGYERTPGYAEAQQTKTFSQPAPAVDRATTLREAADTVDATDLPDDYIDAFDNGATWATAQFRRMAAEAQQPAPAVTEEPTP